jgi:hypothetical protein
MRIMGIRRIETAQASSFCLGCFVRRFCGLQWNVSSQYVRAYEIGGPENRAVLEAPLQADFVSKHFARPIEPLPGCKELS